MKAIPFLISGVAWFLIFNAVIQWEAQVSGAAVFVSSLSAFIAAGWLVYRFTKKA